MRTFHGPCGSGKYAATQNMLSMGTTWFPDDMKNWNSFSRYLEYADKQPLTANAKMYIGHSTLRISVMGMANRPATDKELDTMKGVLPGSYGIRRGRFFHRSDLYPQLLR